jgi:hypothetical protein
MHWHEWYVFALDVIWSDVKITMYEWEQVTNSRNHVLKTGIPFAIEKMEVFHNLLSFNTVESCAENVAKNPWSRQTCQMHTAFQRESARSATEAWSADQRTAREQWLPLANSKYTRIKSLRWISKERPRCPWLSLEAIMVSQKQRENWAQTPWLYCCHNFANERHHIPSALKQWHLLHTLHLLSCSSLNCIKSLQTKCDALQVMWQSTRKMLWFSLWMCT